MSRRLESHLNYTGMERCARRLVLDDKLASAEEVATMTSFEVCELIEEYYEVVFCENEEVGLVKKENIDAYNSIVKKLCR